LNKQALGELGEDLKEDLFPVESMSQYISTRPNTQGGAKHNRRSTFSQYYLNKRTKDLLSIRSGLSQTQHFGENVVDE
jgi:hypothetical protein